MCVSQERLFVVVNIILLISSIAIGIFMIFMTIFDPYDKILKVFTYVLCVVLIINSGCSHRLRRSKCGTQYYVYSFAGLLMLDLIVLLILGLLHRAQNTWNRTGLVIWAAMGCFILIVMMIGAKIDHKSPQEARHQPLT